VAAIGIAGVVVLVAALAGRWSGLLPWALVLSGAEYAVFLILQRGTVDAYAPFYAADLLLCAELAFWSMERQVAGDRSGLRRRRASLVVAACLAAGGLGSVILTASELSVHGGLLLEVLGVAAAVGALALVARLARAEPESK
jgi:hypothetical protein